MSGCSRCQCAASRGPSNWTKARGFLKAVVDTATGQILGGAVLGIEGGELMSILQMAIAAEVPFTRVRDMIFAHPTLAEGLKTLFDED